MYRQFGDMGLSLRKRNWRYEKRLGMKQKKTSNRHVMRLLTIVSILSGIAIISVFYWTSMDYIRSRAVVLLTEFMSSEEGGSG